MHTISRGPTLDKMKRARPQGLGAAAKKAALEETTSVAQPTAKLVFELPADATALDQVKALYETALVSLEEPEKALQLFNGVVHECLRLEAIKESETAPQDLHPDDNDLDSYLQVKKDAERIFCPEFYFIFGDCLRNIAEISMDQVDEESYDHVKGLLLAAKDRFENASAFEGAAFDEAKARTEVMLAVFDGQVPVTTEASEECLFDAIEFICAFIEHVLDNNVESKCEQAQEAKISLLNLLTDLSAAKGEEKTQIDLLSVSIPFRLTIAGEEGNLAEEEANSMIAKLEALKETDMASEVLMLQGSIYEFLERTEEAEACYAAAENLDTEDSNESSDQEAEESEEQGQ